MPDTLFDIPLTCIDGTASTLADYAGQVLLIVNVASKCGLTVQYDGLELLFRSYRDRGLVVLGFPANDFKGQEPGSNAEIADFCARPSASTFRCSARSPSPAPRSIRSTMR